MKAVDVAGREDILLMALHQAEIEFKDINKSLNEIRETEYLLKGTYGAFSKDKEQLKHSRFYYESCLAKVENTIQTIKTWRTEFHG